jgi:hypothetical protein
MFINHSSKGRTVMADQPAFRPELVVHVVWHPDFAAGQQFATFVYDQLTRNVTEPLARGLGIPVYLRTSVSSDGLPEPVPFDQAEHTIVVLLVDDQMMLARDDGWEQYAGSLVQGAKSGAHRLIPVKLSDSAFSLHGELRKRNFLPLDPKMPQPLQQQRLLIGLVHDLCRLLSGSAPVNYESDTETIQAPVRVFLSHAKKDGEKLTLEFKEFLQNELQLDTFFDRNGIFYADDFGTDIEERAKQSALLILQTDAYSTREWCQKEVLFAKKYHRPVLVLDHVEVGETRSFPYLGNVPTLRYKPETPIEEIIGRLLLEVLRFEYFPRQARRAGELFGIDLKDATLLAHSPELINLIPPADAPRLVIYPDPPLGHHEIDLLKSCDPNTRLTTPMFLVTQGSGISEFGIGRAKESLVTADVPRPIVNCEVPDPGLTNRLVGLSLSETAQGDQFAAELQRLGFLPAHFEDAFNELARYLLASGANLAYGGDPRKGGFTERLHGLARQYSEQTQDPALRVEIFLAWIAHIHQPAETLLGLKTNARMRRLPLPADVVAEFGFDPKQPPPATLSQSDNDYLAARCFMAMREAMQTKQPTDSHNTIHARVLLGGPLSGYAGRYPGLVEEAYLAMKANLPVYLIGAFGGCTRAIIDAVEGRQPESLTLAGQITLDESFRRQHPDKPKTPYADRVTNFNTRATKHGVELIDYTTVQSVFESTGSNNLAALSANNGLTPEENHRLFETPHIAEMISLVLNGLRIIGGRV